MTDSVTPKGIYQDSSVYDGTTSEPFSKSSPKKQPENFFDAELSESKVGDRNGSVDRDRLRLGFHAITNKK